MCNIKARTVLCGLAPVLAAIAFSTSAHAADGDGSIESFSDFVAVGGPVMYPLIGFAFAALGVALVKAIQFMRLHVGRRSTVERALNYMRRHSPSRAMAELEQRREPVAKVTAAAIRGKQNPRMNDQLVREEVTRVAQAQLDGLERGLAFLSLVAMIEPLLGLLGTVLGLIEAFQQIQAAGTRVEPATLAGGIWQALLTTATGLSAAIPVAIAYTWLQRVVDVEAQRMEDAATQVFTADLFDAIDESEEMPVEAAKVDEQSSVAARPQAVPA
jgi:biopolymer transport protein ExbB